MTADQRDRLQQLLNSPISKWKASRKIKEIIKEVVETNSHDIYEVTGFVFSEIDKNVKDILKEFET
jgi:hypothetical protein